MDYNFELPWPPSINGYWRNFRGRQIISKRGREYRKESLRLLAAMGLSGENLEGRLSVSITLHPPTLRKYDIDNFCKAPFDALSHAGFWVDDEQLDSLSIAKADKIKQGKIVFNVRKLAPCE